MSGKNLFYYLDGLGNLPEQSMFRVTLEDGFLLLDHVKPHPFGKDKLIQQYKIPADMIVDFGIVKTSELKKQSVLGRGAVGGFLLGPVGAVLGGMSAVGKQKIKSTLAICYIPSGGGDPRTAVFDAEPSGWATTNLSSITKLKKELLKTPKSPAVMSYLGQSTAADGSIML